MSRVLKPASELSESSRRNRAWQHARYAERVLVNGNMVHPDAPHGQLRSYTIYGCRGPLCYAVNRHYAVTGKTTFPPAGAQQFNMNDCITFASDVYPDRRR